MCEAILTSLGVGAATAASIASAAPYVAGAVSAATGLYGGLQSSQAASRQAKAIGDQNAATTQAQNLAFNQRIAATRDQSNAQAETSRRELADRTTSALATRAAQTAALGRQNDVLGAENTTAERLRAEGDRRAQDLLASTAAPVMAQSQTGYEDRAAELLANTQAPTPTGPEATNPDGSGVQTNSGDPVTKQAMARRMGIAAANVRQYGADIARVASYGQPLQDVGQAISGNRTGIMPAATADQLLRSGAGVRLAPTQIAYRGATDYGGAEDATIQSRAQGENSYAGLRFGNETGLANLGQSDATTRAANIAKQETADADWQKQVSTLFAGLGNLGSYGAGLYGNKKPAPAAP